MNANGLNEEWKELEKEWWKRKEDWSGKKHDWVFSCRLFWPATESLVKLFKKEKEKKRKSEKIAKRIIDVISIN